MVDPEFNFEFAIFWVLKNSGYVGRRGGKWFEDEPDQKALAKQIAEHLKKHYTFEPKPGVEPHSIP
jgi:hypothetical protein